MKPKKHSSLITKEEIVLFRNTVQGTTCLKQDRIYHLYKIKNNPNKQARLSHAEDTNESFYFSDEFQPLIIQDDPIRYVRQEVNRFTLKKLRRGDYEPELYLDLHGLTQQDAKKEISALIRVCQKESIHCVCIIHGHGKNILKKTVPLWLAQHPAISAFHQAPKIGGGKAALLVLLEHDTE